MVASSEQYYLRRIAELEAQVAALLEQNARLSEQNARLSEQVARLSKNSCNSSKPPSSDIVKPPRPKRPEGPRRQGGQPGHRGVNRPAFRPEQIDRFEDHHPKLCPHSHRLDPDPTGPPKIHQVAELPEKPLIITQHQLHGHRCGICHRIVWARPPPGVIEGQLLGPRLQTMIAYMKGSLHASYTGLEAFCREVLNLELSRSHLCKTIARVSEALAEPYEELQRHVPTESVLNVDESGWKDCGTKYWIWVFCTAALSFFVIAKTRSSKVLQEVLGQTYGGTLVSDFFSAYVKFASAVRQFCLAHLIRDIKFLTTLPDAGERAFGQRLLLEFKRLFRFWHQRQKIPEDRFDRLMLRLKTRILTLACQEDLPPKSATLAKRFNKHGEAIFRFLFDPAVPPTNNLAEQGIRGSVIDRRITQGTRSLMGREWNARIWTVLGTCHKQGRSAWRFLQEAFDAHYLQGVTPSLLPQPA